MARFGLRLGGSGPPLLLLHGNPQTHAIWHAVAPALAQTHTAVCPDLRGYGGSFKPAPSADHAPYSKVAMARDMMELMDALGHERFDIVSHDRGARVAHRLAIDYPDRVRSLTTMDIIPTVEHFERADMAFAARLLPLVLVRSAASLPGGADQCGAGNLVPRPYVARVEAARLFQEEALADYLAAARDPEAISGMCEDYRAAATIDLMHDRISRADGRRVKCPMLVLWGSKGRIGGCMTRWRSGVPTAMPR